ncbi:MAG TPA: glutathione S-transferase family protein [Cyanobacteria bacterium UBA11049]|nr:glutathione S-transferase family protein [Cyanobacteria bacterium UBA11049]
MLKLYHTPISANSRRVWITLLEKGIPFEEVLLKLDGDQFHPEFLEISPFHHIPVLIDDGFKIVESLAILDYLEAKYPTPPLMPTDAKAIATVRMVEMVTLNELLPAMIRLTSQAMGFVENDPQKLEQAKQKTLAVLKFFENLLGDSPYFGSDGLTLADIVAGTTVPQLPLIGVTLDDYPKLSAWSDRLMQRETWVKTQPSQEELAAFIPRMKTLMRAYLAN